MRAYDTLFDVETTISPKEHIPLAGFTTFGIGGPARYWYEARSIEEIRAAYGWAHEHGVPVVVLGGGSNVVVPDEGLDALVLRISTPGVVREGTTLRVAAGENLLGVVRAAAAAGLGGLEDLAGIPGSVGGAVRGNAGAFGGELKDSLVKATALDMRSGATQSFTTIECQFAYRTSYFKQHPEWVVVEAEFALTPVDCAVAEATITNTLAERTKRHIQDIKSAGSFFKNPVVPRDLQELFEKDKSTLSKEGRVPAGWLMDKAGLRGARVGDAVASEYHTNYFLNAGNATAAEVQALAALAKETVHATFGVELEAEAVVL